MAVSEIRIISERFEQVKTLIPQRAGQGVRAFAQYGRNHMVQLIQTHNGGGRVATRYNPKRTVTVSPEGAAPNTDIGTLVNSIDVKSDGPFRQIINVGAEHGLPLEHGTERMEARPFVGPTLLMLQEEAEPFFVGYFRNIE